MALDQNKNIGGKTVAEWVAQIPAIGAAVRGEETAWLNESKPSFAEAMAHSELTAAHVKDASDRLARFAGYFMRVFPETAENGGMIESPLRAIPHMQDAIRCKYGAAIDGELWIKLDSHLPISGSIKARGGIYEVLSIAEGIAMREGGLKETDDYAVLAEPTFRDLFSTYEIAVGSTGNLGLSIGIMSAKLGFRVTVHMSADARQWKKDMLRSRGVTVVEYEDDYSVAVENGRRAAEGNPRCYFIDDENSRTLFLGYSVAAERLKKQLEAEGVHIDGDNPLYVYLPCGVGGGPGGVAFGLKLQFGDAVHCFFAEPTHSCCMLLGMATGLHNGVATSDFGIDNRTVADGLAVGRASGFVGKQMYGFMDGCYTVRDERMNALLKMLCDEEGLRLEPSALAGMFGPVLVGQKQGGYHLVWATGGSMVPDEEYQKYYRAGEAACKSF